MTASRQRTCIVPTWGNQGVSQNDIPSTSSTAAPTKLTAGSFTLMDASSGPKIPLTVAGELNVPSRRRWLRLLRLFASVSQKLRYSGHGDGDPTGAIAHRTCRMIIYLILQCGLLQFEREHSTGVIVLPDCFGVTATDIRSMIYISVLQ